MCEVGFKRLFGGFSAQRVLKKGPTVQGLNSRPTAGALLEVNPLGPGKIGTAQ